MTFDVECRFVFDIRAFTSTSCLILFSVCSVFCVNCVYFCVFVFFMNI